MQTIDLFKSGVYLRTFKQEVLEIIIEVVLNKVIFEGLFFVIMINTFMETIYLKYNTQMYQK